MWRGLESNHWSSKRKKTTPHPNFESGHGSLIPHFTQCHVMQKISMPSLLEAYTDLGILVKLFLIKLLIKYILFIFIVNILLIFIYFYFMLIAYLFLLFFFQISSVLFPPILSVRVKTALTKNRELECGQSVDQLTSSTDSGGNVEEKLECSIAALSL